MGPYFEHVCGPNYLFFLEEANKYHIHFEVLQVERRKILRKKLLKIYTDTSDNEFSGFIWDCFNVPFCRIIRRGSCDLLKEFDYRGKWILLYDSNSDKNIYEFDKVTDLIFMIKQTGDRPFVTNENADFLFYFGEYEDMWILGSGLPWIRDWLPKHPEILAARKNKDLETCFDLTRHWRLKGFETIEHFLKVYPKGLPEESHQADLP